MMAALGLPACSGPPADDPDADAEEATADVSGDAAPSSASVRFVHLWAHEGSTSAVDVYAQPGFRAQELVRAGLDLGEVATLHVPNNSTLYAYRSGEPGVGEGYGAPSLVAEKDLEGDLATGVPLTVVLMPARSLGERPGGAMRVFHDAGDYVIESLPVKPAEGGLVVADMSALGMLAGAPVPRYTLGMPGGGCLRPAGETPRPGISVSAGGHSVFQYDVPAGATQVATYSMDGTHCEGSPGIGPIDAEVPPGGRTYVFAYGTSSEDLRLLSVPASQTD
jgi:hypothetical protein